MFKEIFEVFDNPYKWTGKNSKFSFDADGQRVDVEWDRDYTWEPLNTHYVNLEFWVDGQQDITGKGDAFRIFATVLDIIKQNKSEFEITNSTGFITFFASSESRGRVKMYKRLSKILKKEMNYKHELSTTARDGVTFFLYNDKTLTKLLENA